MKLLDTFGYLERKFASAEGNCELHGKQSVKLVESWQRCRNDNKNFFFIDLMDSHFLPTRLWIGAWGVLFEGVSLTRLFKRPKWRFSDSPQLKRH